MNKKNITITVLAIWVAVSMSALVFIAYKGHQFYNKIFRVSQEQVSFLLNDIDPECEDIKKCRLLAGDILIRRHLTERTGKPARLANSYFTHSAFYIGDGLIVEAIGTEKNQEDEIRVTKISETDWFDEDLNTFVVIRPQNYSGGFEDIKRSMIAITNDPDYRFGLPKAGHKRVTCADLIFNPLFEKGVIQISDPPEIITPDYLFWVLTEERKNTKVIGHANH